jgi:hypothetical protein
MALSEFIGSPFAYPALFFVATGKPPLNKKNAARIEMKSDSHNHRTLSPRILVFTWSGVYHQRLSAATKNKRARWFQKGCDGATDNSYLLKFSFSCLSIISIYHQLENLLSV